MFAFNLIVTVQKNKIMAKTPEKMRKMTAFLKKSGCCGILFKICLNILPFLVTKLVRMTIARVFYPL
jgi:hypothetical protein